MPSTVTGGSAEGVEEEVRLEAHHEPAVVGKGGDPYDLNGIQTLCRSCHVDHHRPVEIDGQAGWNALVGEIETRDSPETA